MPAERRYISLLAAACILACSIGGPTVAGAASWKKVSPPSKFVKFAKHARAHGMRAWYPGRIPSGFVLSGISVGDVGLAGPYCSVTFRKGAKRLYVYSGTIVGADGDPGMASGRCDWGTSHANVYPSSSVLGTIVWSGPANGVGSIAAKGLSLGSQKGVAKYMRTVR